MWDFWTHILVTNQNVICGVALLKEKSEACITGVTDDIEQSSGKFPSSFVEQEYCFCPQKSPHLHPTLRQKIPVMPSRPACLRSIFVVFSVLCLCLSSYLFICLFVYLFISRFSTEIVYAFVLSACHALPASSASISSPKKHTMTGRVYSLLSSSLCYLYCVLSQPSGPDTLIRRCVVWRSTSQKGEEKF
jgi:hypothetical protein